MWPPWLLVLRRIEPVELLPLTPASGAVVAREAGGVQRLVLQQLTEVLPTVRALPLCLVRAMHERCVVAQIGDRVTKRSVERVAAEA